MKFRITTLLGTTAGAALAATAAFAGAAPYPAMSGSIAANASPATFDLGVLGKDVTIGGVLSAYGQTQTNHVFGDQSSSIDLSNAQVFINKSDGVFQYFIQAGTYSLPALGPFPYVFSSGRNGAGSVSAPAANYGNLPQGFVKIVPPGPFSFEIGALPTLVGDEYTFTFENLNINRGLLWGVEPAVSRGVQANYAAGPFAVSLAWTDGFYSNKYNTISGLGTWTIDATDTLAADFQLPTSETSTYSSTFVTVPSLHNEKIYNVMYTHTMGQWTFNPYVQYTSLPQVATAGLAPEDTYGAAILVNYAFDAKSPLSGLSLPFRVEYLATHGDLAPASGFGAPSLPYPAGSNAWSFTITPTYQYKAYFVRGEVAYVSVGKLPSSAFGAYDTTGEKSTQVRGAIEAGVAF